MQEIFTCSVCGKMVERKYRSGPNRYCSKKCYGKYLHEAAERRDGGEDERPKGQERNICEKGYWNLVNAVVESARDDVMKYPSSNPRHKDAERFFRSSWFGALTGMDGTDVLNTLLRLKAEKKRRSRG